MIIVLKGADFSQSNIGKINLPEDSYQFLDITTEVLGRFSKNFTFLEKKAVDLFFIKISNAGILSNIKGLLLPILASNIDEACTNVLDGNLAVNNKDSLDLTPKGFKPIIGQPVSYFNINNEELSHVAMYVNSIGKYIIRTDGTNSGQYAWGAISFISGGKNAINSQKQPCIQTSDVSKRLTFDINYANNDSSIIASYDSDTKTLYGSVGGEFKSSVVDTTVTQTSRINIGAYQGNTYETEGANSLQAALQSDLSIISYGGFLDEEQHIAYNLALEELNNAFVE